MRTVKLSKRRQALRRSLPPEQTAQQQKKHNSLELNSLAYLMSQFL